MQLIGSRIALAAALILLGAASCLAADDTSPFGVSPAITNVDGKPHIIVSIQVPAGHRLYADAISFEINGAATSFDSAKPVDMPDRHSGKTKPVFTNSFTASTVLESAASSLAVNLHGCNEQECYFPETRRWQILSNHFVADLDSALASEDLETNLVSGFTVAARTTGFQSAESFLEFLTSTDGTPGGENTFAGMSTAAMIALILLGGMALNLTPCVLPMIPINLAILGAGASNTKRARGFLLGTAYGGGMAAAYGTVGIVVVVTGSKFGALNSSAWFNFGIAAVFVVLGLAMLDKLNIDFSRFQRGGGKNMKSRWAWLGAGTMGAVSALLAGACVAPVVISVLLLATTFHQQGNLLGLLLPLLLGIGMALPWPFAAAGLSFLPKPGAWMVRVKHAFAVLIFGFALWYGSIGWSLARPMQALARNQANVATTGADTLRKALAQSRATGRPVLIDFWASWCKNCAAMEATTLHDSSVRARLQDFIVVKFQAEHLDDTAIKPVLDEFGVMGLPTFVVLKPKEQHTPGPFTARAAELK